jgi:hypothetical protein
MFYLYYLMFYLNFFYMLCIFFKLTGYDLLFKDFFKKKIHININLGSNIFLFFNMDFFYGNWD